MNTVFHSLYAALMSGMGWTYILVCFGLCGLLGLYYFMNGKD